jgi:hypothetical protein
MPLLTGVPALEAAAMLARLEPNEPRHLRQWARQQPMAAEEIAARVVFQADLAPLAAEVFAGNWRRKARERILPRAVQTLTQLRVSPSRISRSHEFFGKMVNTVAPGRCCAEPRAIPQRSVCR